MLQPRFEAIREQVGPLRDWVCQAKIDCIERLTLEFIIKLTRVSIAGRTDVKEMAL